LTQQSSNQEKLCSQMEMKIAPSTGSSRDSGKKNPLSQQPSVLDSKLKKLTDNLDPNDGEEKAKNTIEIYRVQLKAFMHNNFFGQLYNTFLLIISILSVFQYIYGTYVDRYFTKTTTDVQHMMGVIELTFASIFGFDWSLNLFLTDNKNVFFTR
jgi:hypothetical protein